MFPSGGYSNTSASGASGSNDGGSQNTGGNFFGNQGINMGGGIDNKTLLIVAAVGVGLWLLSWKK